MISSQFKLTFSLFAFWMLMTPSQGRVLNGSLVEFQFLRDECLNNNFNNIYENNSTSDENTYTSQFSIGQFSYPQRNATEGYDCFQHNGVHSTSTSDYLESSRNISSIKDSFGESYTVEFWIQVNTSSDQIAPILSITNPRTSSSCFDYFKVIIYDIIIHEIVVYALNVQ